MESVFLKIGGLAAKQKLTANAVHYLHNGDCGLLSPWTQ